MNFLELNKDTILEEMKSYDEFYDVNDKLDRCLQGDQLSVLKEHFNNHKSIVSRRDKKLMAVSVPFVRHVCDRLSDIYTREVVREALVDNKPSAEDQTRLDFYKEKLDLNTVGQNSNENFNILKSGISEVYEVKVPGPLGRYKLGARPVSPTSMFFWTDDVLEPNKAKVAVKFVGKCKAKEGSSSLAVGTKKWKKKPNLYFAYTDEFYLAFDSNGDIREEYKGDTGWMNLYEKIPFAYVTQNKYDIMSRPNFDLLQCTINVNSILTDAVVASYYQSFPVRVLINADTDSMELEINPHTILDLKGVRSGAETLTPDFHEVSSSLDTSRATALAEKIWIQFLSCLGLEASTSGGAPAANSSGVSLAIKAGSLVENRNKQIEYFKPFEKETCRLIAHIHNNLYKRNRLDPKESPLGSFSENFDVKVEFQLPSTEVDTIKAIDGKDGEKTKEGTVIEKGATPNDTEGKVKGS